MHCPPQLSEAYLQDAARVRDASLDGLLPAHHCRNQNRSTIPLFPKRCGVESYSGPELVSALEAWLKCAADSFGLLPIPSDSFGLLPIPSDSFRFLPIPSDSFRFLGVLCRYGHVIDPSETDEALNATAALADFEADHDAWFGRECAKLRDLLRSRMRTGFDALGPRPNASAVHAASEEALRQVLGFAKHLPRKAMARGVELSVFWQVKAPSDSSGLLPFIRPPSASF